MAERTVEDRLREEYFELLPEIRRVTDELEAEIRYQLLLISRGLDRHEQLLITSRVKECESAVESLRRRQQLGTFDSEKAGLYTLSTLHDLAAVRILAFPRSLLAEADRQLFALFPSWTSDPVRGGTGETLAFKYHGLCRASDRVVGEYQIVSMLTELFWEVEHSAIYKPTPRLRGITRSLEMQKCTDDVHRVLRAFEEEFERLIYGDPPRDHEGPK